MAKMKIESSKCYQECKVKEFSHIVGESIKWCNISDKHLRVSHKVTNTLTVALNSSIPR